MVEIARTVTRATVTQFDVRSASFQEPFLAQYSRRQVEGDNLSSDEQIRPLWESHATNCFARQRKIVTSPKHRHRQHLL
jgi:hypothetical protein